MVKKKPTKKLVCDDCGAECKEIGPDTFGTEFYCPKCKNSFAGAY